LTNERAVAAGPGYKFRPDFAKIRQRGRESRSPERLVAHYALERRLSDRLRLAPREARGTIYTEVYTELAASLPDHPLNSAARSGTVQRIDGQLRQIAGHLRDDSAFLEVGCGNAALAFAAAKRTAIAYAVDVTDAWIDFAAAPSNFRFIQTNGVEIPLASASVDLAYSNQLMEHLHPDDAADQLKEIQRVLKPGGHYICITPSRVTGPHDISCYFDYEATCFHLREYDYATLRTLFRDAGFAKFRCCVSARGHQFRIPYPAIRTFELVFSALPAQMRAALTRPDPFCSAMGLNATGIK
jgi:ubiquinone/menaquinone biosynthesis C-methylase UbiE